MNPAPRRGLDCNTTKETMMAKVRFEISMSLDGYVAGPNQSHEDPLGEGGEALHDWVVKLEAWRKSHGHEGGEVNESSPVMEEAMDNIGAVIMGRGMFGPPGGGPWGEEPWNGWWGDDPPFHVPVFVVTHHDREPLTLTDTAFTFVTGGVQEAYEQAVEAAAGKDVKLSGGAEVANQMLVAGLIDQIDLNVVPLLLGGGERLFADLGGSMPKLELERTVAGPEATHLRYRVVN
jgi:dihydrofolate reductase